ncbi:MAG: toll/interleukin-1 receptor domain-containing protein [Acidobacteriota bacterium]
MGSKTAPRLFFSYCQESESHSARVRNLARRLADDGCVCILDQWTAPPEVGWPQWMNSQIEKAEFVLVVCTEEYLQRATGQRKPSGVRFECVLIIQDLYDSAMVNKRFIPILFSDSSPEHIVRPLKGFTYYRVDRDRSYEDLLRHITNQPRHIPPTRGRVPHLPPESPPAVSSKAAVRDLDAPAAGFLQSPAFIYGKLSARGLLDSKLTENPYRFSADPTDETSVGVEKNVSAFLWIPHSDYMKQPQPFTPLVALCTLRPKEVVNSTRGLFGDRALSVAKRRPSKLWPSEKELLLSIAAEILEECFTVAVTTPAALLSGGRRRPDLAYRVLLDLFLFPLLDMHKRLEVDQFHLKLQGGDPKRNSLLKTTKQDIKSVFPHRSNTVELVEATEESTIFLEVGRYLGWILNRHYNEGKRDWLDRLKTAIGNESKGSLDVREEPLPHG